MSRRRHNIYKICNKKYMTKLSLSPQKSVACEHPPVNLHMEEMENMTARKMTLTEREREMKGECHKARQTCLE